MTIQKVTRGYLVRKRVGYMIRVSRELRTMNAELEQLKKAYEKMPEFQGKGVANVSHLLLMIVRSHEPSGHFT